MAEDLYNCIIAITELIGEIIEDGKRFVRKVHLGPPDSVVTGLEVAISVDTLRHRQIGTMAHGQRHFLLLRCYAPIGGDVTVAEKKLLKLWNLMLDKFDTNVTLKGTVTHHNIDQGRMGYRTVAGVKCRTLDARMNAFLAESRAYQA